jgi:hypothetical protein
MGLGNNLNVAITGKKKTGRGHLTLINISASTKESAYASDL